MSAQMEGKWLKKQSEADELKGTSGGTYYSYVVPGLGAFVIFDFNTYQYFLLSEKEQFNIETGYNQFAGSYAGITVLVGIYDENNKLTEKFKMWLDRSENKANRVVKTRNAGGMSNPVGQKGKVKKIFKALCERKTVKGFNSQLMKLMQISPRRVRDISTLLAYKESDFSRIIDREESLILSMEAMLRDGNVVQMMADLKAWLGVMKGKL